MGKLLKRLAVLITLIILASGTVIYFTVDINTIGSLTMFHPWSIALAILSVGIGLFLDGSRLMHLVRLSNEDIRLHEAVEVVFGNYFLALLTPGQAGGAVAQLMFLRHAGVPTGKATVVVFVRTVVSILFLILCMPFIFMHDDHILPGVSNGRLKIISFAAFLFIVFLTVAIGSNMLNHVAVRIARRLSVARRRSFIKVFRDTQK